VKGGEKKKPWDEKKKRGRSRGGTHQIEREGRVGDALNFSKKREPDRGEKKKIKQKGKSVFSPVEEKKPKEPVFPLP